MTFVTIRSGNKLAELEPRLAVIGGRDVVEASIAEDPAFDEVPDVWVVVDEEDALVPRRLARRSSTHAYVPCPASSGARRRHLLHRTLKGVAERVEA